MGWKRRPVQPKIETAVRGDASRVDAAGGGPRGEGVYRAAMRKRALPSSAPTRSGGDQESTMPKPALLPPNTVRHCRLFASVSSGGMRAGDQPAAAPAGLSTP